MSRSPRILIGAAYLVAAASLACTRASGSAARPPAGHAGSEVGEDVEGVAKATQKAARDIGRATVELADHAGEDLKQAASKAGVRGDDAWLTTKVKTALTAEGLDPLHVHVDTDGKVVTLSGTVESAARARQAVSAAKAVPGVVGVDDRLFVAPAQR